MRQMMQSSHAGFELLAIVIAMGFAVSLYAENSVENSVIEATVNGRLKVVKKTVLFDSAKFSTGRTPSRNVESIAWSPDGRFLLMDQKGLNQFFAIARTRLDGDKVAGKTSVLSNNRITGNTRLNNSNPAWFPTGKYFVFTGQDNSSSEYKRSLPGYGFFSNLWLADTKGTSFSKLTHEVSTYNAPKGAVMPRFSPDGRKLFWTRCEAPLLNGNYGERSLMLADFKMRDDNSPELSAIQSFQPGGTGVNFYESYGFSPDGNDLLYAANMTPGEDWFCMDICTQPVKSTAVKQLTRTPGVWDRYAAFTPNGKKILWSSSQGYSVAYLGPAGSQWQQSMITELWIMNKDGSDKKRLTGFNDTTSPDYIATRCYVGMVACHPDGKHVAIVLHKQYNVYNTTSSVILLEFDNMLAPFK